jgi:hypothetical protein
MMNRRPVFMVLVGSAVFLVGAALVLMSLQSRPASAASRHVASSASVPAAAAGPAASTSEVGLTAGHQAVAVTTPSPAAGLAAYLGPGDVVDVYATITHLSSAGPGPAAGSTAPVPCTVLVAADVPVIDVSLQVPEFKGHQSSAGRPLPGSLTVLLSATTAQAPALVFAAGNESIYLTQVPGGTAAAPAGTCVGTVQVLTGGGL